ncbi:MAG: asparagine synthase (glutamine-hydrolyzing) [Planctomycetota bacterium]
MCGIAGIVWQTSERPPDEAIHHMARRLHHRGPDDTGIAKPDGCDLAHTRLSIVDPVGGRQPLASPYDPACAPFTLVFNGEVYNHADLRQQLERRGQSFTTTSDTEVLLHQFALDGAAALDRLNGQFAFAVWDADQRRLFAARDRLGEKPFYYAIDPLGRLVFASEIKAILASGLIRPTIRRAAIDSVLGLMHTQPHETVYHEVHALPPGHTLSWQDGRLTISPYWQPSYGWRDDITYPEAVAEVRRRLEAAVQRQRLADVPVGALLSGGLDSSTLTALLAKQSGSAPMTFAAGFGELIDELPYARAVADHYGTDHHELQLDMLPVEDLLPTMAKVYDEPFADSSALPTYLLCAFASRHVKAVVGGDGADELFGGYGWTRPLLLGESCRQGITAGTMRWLNWQAKRVGLRLGMTDRQAAELSAARYTAGRTRRHQPDPWARRIARATDASAAVIDPRFHPANTLVGVDRATDFDLRVYLPGDILTKIDRAAMAHGLETRSPFLDHELVEFVLSLPADLRLDQRRTKPLLRDSCGELWPSAVQSRGKQGFGAPVRNWLSRPGVDELWQRVTGKQSPLAQWFDGVIPWTNDPDPQRRWRVLSVGLWLEHHTALGGLSRAHTTVTQHPGRVAA